MFCFIKLTESISLTQFILYYAKYPACINNACKYR
jgi:hypothetical protein